MNVDTMRGKLLNMYPGSVGWTYRVCHMADNQVMAIYLTSYEKRMKDLNEGKPENLAEQLCMFEDADKRRADARKEWLETYGHLYD